VSLREVLEGRLTDARKPQGKRHPLTSLVSVLVAGVAAACTGPLAVAQAFLARDITSGSARSPKALAERARSPVVTGGAALARKAVDVVFAIRPSVTTPELE